MRRIAFFSCLVFAILLSINTSFGQNIIRVDSASTCIANCDGSTWAKAIIELRDALDSLSAGDELWVSKGTYFPTDTTQRNISFVIPDSVTILGGFSGIETDRSERNHKLNVTILSGDIGVIGDQSDNSRHVVYSENLSSQCWIDGFTIKHGNASGSGNKKYGGGWFNLSMDGVYSNPKISRILFFRNHASAGGGMYNLGEDSSKCNPQLVQCNFIENKAGEGAGVYNSGFGTECSPYFSNCAFVRNEATSGGGLYNHGSFNGESSPTLINCTISGNAEVVVYGPIITSFGGGMYNKGSGGGISNPLVINTILYGNETGVENNSANPIYRHSLVQGKNHSSNGNIPGDTDPLFVQMPDYNVTSAANWNIKLLPCSPVVNAGANDSLDIVDTLDLNGNSRIVDGVVDMGAYEYQGTANDSIFFVDQKRSGDGTSWFNAYSDLQLALAIANTCDMRKDIWVAEGTYYPTTDSGRDSSFHIPDSFRLYGGFAGTESHIDERSWTEHESILSGDIGIEGDSSDNSYHVVYSENVSNETLLDGFTIKDGNANGSSPDNNGGGWYNEGDENSSSDPRILNIKFKSNKATNSGGALLNQGFASPDLEDCIFTNNSAAFGGAVLNRGTNGRNASPSFNRCLFSNNSAGTSGGASYNSGYNNGISNPTFINCLISGNSAKWGGAFFNDGGDTSTSISRIINCTFSGNYASIRSGAIRLLADGGGNGQLILTNTVLWGNYDEYASNNQTNSIDYIEGTGIVNGCLIEYFDDGGTNLDGTDSLNDPLFYFPINPIDAPTAAGDFRVLRCSPLIDAGISDSLEILDSLDLNKNARISNSSVDIGAYEYQGNIDDSVIYVNANAEINGDGSNWEAAFPDLQDGLKIANKCGVRQIWVAGGTYYPTSDSLRNVSFEIPDSVKVYGCFDGTETARIDRDCESVESILSGDIGVEEDSSDNSYHVVYTKNVSSETMLDGFTIKDGNANGGSPDNDGGGWYNESSGGDSSNVAIRNIKFENNRADNRGGALFNKGLVKSFLYDCAFSQNEAEFGGAVLNLGRNGGNASPIFSHCLFSENMAIQLGGAMYNSGNNGVSNPEFRKCIFNSNMANFGGGVFTDGRNSGQSSPSFSSCSFFSNSASNNGGAIYNYGFSGFSRSNLVNSLFSGNIAGYGGGIYSNGGDNGHSTILLTNCTFSGNYASTLGGAIGQFPGNGKAHLIFANTIIWGNLDSNGEGAASGSIHMNGGSGVAATSLLENFTIVGGNNLDGNDTLNDPRFKVPLDPMLAPSSDGDYSILHGSPVINWGRNDSLDVADSMDLAGNPRIIFNKVDLGAYEFTYHFPCGVYDTLAIDDVPIFGVEYKASSLISSEGTVSPTYGPVIFESQSTIELRKNFEVKLGETFEARIKDPCFD